MLNFSLAFFFVFTSVFTVWNEELYLQPSIKSRGQMGLVKTLGNPTALGIVSFLLTFAPTSCCLMGWRGASSNSLLALIGAYYFMGGEYLAFRPADGQAV